MVPVLMRDAYERLTCSMRELHGSRFTEDVRRDAVPPHVCASATASVPSDVSADDAAAALTPWLRLGVLPCVTLLLTSDPAQGVSVYLQVRGVIDEAGGTREEGGRRSS
jgi:anti-sigma factor RsiW